MIDISVIIPVYNAGVFIHKCLDAIIAQQGGFTYEIILVDDGSTDNSVEIIHSYAESTALRRSNGVVVLMQQRNSGPSKARNRAIDAAKGKYIAFIDADDYWKPDFFLKTVSFLEKHEDCIGVSVQQQVDTVSGMHVTPQIPGEGLLDKDVTAFANGYVIDDFFSFWGKRMHICPGGAMMRTDTVKATGGMREDLRITEDLEFWGYSALFGKWGLIPEVLFVGCGAQTVTTREEWNLRMKRRWDNAPTVEDWERRLIVKNASLRGNESYRIAQGAISRNLTYCQLLSGRYELAMCEAKKYGAYFKDDVIGRLMKMARHNMISWWMLCKFLQYREENRF